MTKYLKKHSQSKENIKAIKDSVKDGFSYKLKFTYFPTFFIALIFFIFNFGTDIMLNDNHKGSIVILALIYSLLILFLPIIDFIYDSDRKYLKVLNLIYFNYDKLFK